jgi:hypothetical protein
MGYSAFWNTIQQEEQRLAALPHRQAMEGIGEYLKAHFPELSPEIAGNSEKTYTLIFTAHGITEHFEDVMRLTRAAPELKYFDVEAFRQRADLGGFDMKLGDFSLNCQEIFVTQQPSGGRIALTLSFAKDIAAEMEDHAKNMAFILLDHMLGEFDFAVKVDQVDFIALDQNQDAIALTEYPPIFDDFWSNQLGHSGEYPNGEGEWIGFELTSKENADDKMVVLRNESANSLVCRADMGERLDVSVTLYDSETLDMSRDFEDRLDLLLSHFQEGLCCQTVLHRGVRRMSWYVNDKDSALMKAQRLAQEFPDLELQFASEFDPAWSHYLRWVE